MLMVVMEFIESPIFTKLINKYLSDEEYSVLQWELLSQPNAGAIIPSSGGLRKLRWKAEGRGKSSGYRVIYYWQDQRGQIWLLAIYVKNEVENIPAHILKAIKKEIVNE